ncbi:hypothetical protein RFI36_06550 [Acinetobacter gerneri]|uniref:Uncharacterized protein n=1 Tax=Acinetobacter gerneri TaxID=202952 RepID=A0AAW8JI99_9GAMM|nr:hypothetical protein [Acinetobacter gerneri]MDQ9009394.1 hypothetical protein [Acinetobacter gerneri]MDQ9013404.1 hypothetical protein [Acinetobacter gerneri]MDQ9024686.1 hypothetical protein [Acinetobacter gerneri]MDQ9052076.1 hypothetical protein [Acinetobacter gerneri]MDQ9059569.1 hypothetical protein [Acinetobacter gerneri]
MKEYPNRLRFECFYYSHKSLMATDLNRIIYFLIKKYGSTIDIIFSEMDETQKLQSTDIFGKLKILGIVYPIHLYFYNLETGEKYRDLELEQYIK